MPLQATGSAADRRTMRRLLVLTTAVAAALTLTGPAGAAGSSSIAALQVALQAHGFYPAAVDGVQGPLTTTGLTNLQRVKGIPVTGRSGRRRGRRSGRSDARCSGSASSPSAPSAGTSPRSSSG